MFRGENSKMQTLTSHVFESRCVFFRYQVQVSSMLNIHYPSSITFHVTHLLSVWRVSCSMVHEENNFTLNPLNILGDTTVKHQCFCPWKQSMKSLMPCSSTEIKTIAWKFTNFFVLFRKRIPIRIFEIVNPKQTFIATLLYQKKY